MAATTARRWRCPWRPATAPHPATRFRPPAAAAACAPRGQVARNPTGRGRGPPLALACVDPHANASGFLLRSERDRGGDGDLLDLTLLVVAGGERDRAARAAGLLRRER